MRSTDYVIFAILAVFFVWLMLLTTRDEAVIAPVTDLEPTPSVYVMPSPSPATLDQEVMPDSSGSPFVSPAASSPSPRSTSSPLQN